MSPDAIIASLRDIVAQARPIVMAGVGSGLTAAGAANGGAHLIAAYSTAVYRCRGLPSVLSFLPYDNANDLAFSVAADVVEQAGACPVILGLGVHDPRAAVDGLLDRVEAFGAVGIMNEPFVGMYSAEIRADLDTAGFGFRREVALVERAATRNMLAYAWAFTPDEAREMVGSGARVGRDLLEQTLLAYDGIREGSPLTREMLAVFRDRPEDVVEFTTNAKPGDFGGFAPKVFDHAQKGDAVAVWIVDRAVADVEAALGALDLSDDAPLCLLGGLAPLYAPRLSERFRGLLREPLGDALSGAVRMAARAFAAPQGDGNS